VTDGAEASKIAAGRADGGSAGTDNQQRQSGHFE
jgi:hypothetical protein